MKNLLDCVLLIHDAFPKDLCERIISEYADDSNWEKSEIVNGQDTRYRTSYSVGVSRADVISLNPKVRAPLEKEIHSRVSENLDKYWSLHPTLDISTDSGFNLLRYEKGQEFKWHADEGPNLERRAVSASFLISEGFTGGEFIMFENDQTEIPLKQGDAIFFPSNFIFSHMVKPIISGVRYSFVVWFG
jgi:predicted 2-oxoglutarate/Fe(II)-dependent dioxygenase YbiX